MMIFKDLPDKTIIMFDIFKVAEITPDGFHVLRYNPVFSYDEMRRITKKMKEREQV